MLTTDRARKRCGKEARDDDCDWVERDQVASQGAPCNAVATRRLNSPIDRSERNLKKRILPLLEDTPRPERLRAVAEIYPPKTTTAQQVGSARCSRASQVGRGTAEADARPGVSGFIPVNNVRVFNGSPRGGVTNFSPSADAVQELRVSVNNFSAEYG